MDLTNLKEDTVMLYKALYEIKDIELVKDIYMKTIQDVMKLYNLPLIDVEIFADKDAAGSYNKYKQVIEINEKIFDTEDKGSLCDILHTALHEVRHYLQYEYLTGKAKIPENVGYLDLSKEEKEIVLKEFLNPATIDAIILVSGQVGTFPFFYYSKVHEKDAVETSLDLIEEIANGIENIEIQENLYENVDVQRSYFKHAYDFMTNYVANQKEMAMYDTKETILGLKNKKIEDANLINTAIHEYLPISMALTEKNLLNDNNLKSEKITFGKYTVDFAVNNGTWMLNIARPYMKDTLEYMAIIKNNNCCLYNVSSCSNYKEDRKNLEDVFDILKAFSKVYSEKYTNIDTFTITPLIGLYNEKQRQNLFLDVAKLEKLAYDEEPNKVFIKTNFTATKKTPYITKYVDKIRKFIEVRKDTLDQKIAAYEKLQVANQKHKNIEDMIK